MQDNLYMSNYECNRVRDIVIVVSFGQSYLLPDKLRGKFEVCAVVTADNEQEAQTLLGTFARSYLIDNPININCELQCRIVNESHNVLNIVTTSKNWIMADSQIILGNFTYYETKFALVGLKAQYAELQTNAKKFVEICEELKNQSEILEQRHIVDDNTITQLIDQNKKLEDKYDTTAQNLKSLQVSFDYKCQEMYTLQAKLDAEMTKSNIYQELLNDLKKNKRTPKSNKITLLNKDLTRSIMDDIKDFNFDSLKSRAERDKLLVNM